MADREPPPTDPTDPGPQSSDTPSNVVPLRGHAARKPKTPGMPERTGVSTMTGDALLANLRESCLTDDTIDAARLFTVPSSKWRAYGFTGGSAARPQSGLVLPFFAPGAVEPYGYRLRPQYPLPTRKKGKYKKYDQTFGESVSLVYTPPLAATLERLRSRDVPLYWTEGEKKALLLAQLGLCVVGLTGVDMWHDLEAKAHRDGLHLHPYIAEHYEVAGRAHVIVFDADARSPQKPGIMLAAQKLARVLLDAGATSVHLCLPPEGGGAKGIDDYAHAHGVDACASLLATVREPIDDIAVDTGCLPLKSFGRHFVGSGVEHLRMPPGYSVERDGSVWFDDATTPDDPPRLVLDAPLVIARELETLRTGELRLEYRFKNKRGAWQSVIAPRKLDIRALVAVLRDRGALVNVSTAVQRYLDAFEGVNPHMQLHYCWPSTGWQRDQFVLTRPVVRPGDTGVPVHLDESNEALKRLAATVGPRAGSDPLGHVNALRVPMQASRECALAVFAALAAPMLHLLGQANFALHLCGDSSRGKTSMLRIAGSVFGDPHNPDWIASWNGTGVGIERRAAMLNDLPQLYDELGSGNIEDTQRNVYMLVNGEGRTRGTRDAEMRATSSWRTVVISTGERELVTEHDATGAQVRVIGVDVLGFGDLDARAIDAAVSACAAQYGALGQWWLEYLVGLSDDERATMRAVYARYLGELRAVAAERGDRLAQRSAGFFAVMQVVESALCGATGGVLGRDDGGTVRDVFAERAGDVTTRVESADETLVSILRDWIAQEGEAGFPNVVGGRDWPSRKVCGYKLDDGCIGFIPTALTDYLRARNPPVHLTRALKRELERKGVLSRESARTSYSTRVQVGRVRLSLVRFNLSANMTAVTLCEPAVTEDTAFNSDGLG